MPKPGMRTSFDLDDSTLGRLDSLAAAWGLSRSEAVRRALELAERERGGAEIDPLQRLRAYHADGGLNPAVAEEFLESVAENRRFWGGGE